MPLARWRGGEHRRADALFMSRAGYGGPFRGGVDVYPRLAVRAGILHRLFPVSCLGTINSDNIAACGQGTTSLRQTFDANEYMGRTGADDTGDEAQSGYGLSGGGDSTKRLENSACWTHQVYGMPRA